AYLGRRVGLGTHSVRGRGPGAPGWAAGGPGGGPGGGGGRVAAGNAVRAMLSRREARRAQLPRLLDGLCLLRLHPPHERRRHELAPAPARAVVARGGGGGRELTRASALRCA